MQYNFEWDPEKALANRRRHGVSFEEGASVFLDPRMLSIFDEEHSVVEDRWLTLGLSAAGRLLVVCHTFREEARDSAMVRIFSARKATGCERRQYGGYR
jgi:uncharacterized protein